MQRHFSTKGHLSWRVTFAQRQKESPLHERSFLQVSINVKNNNKNQSRVKARGNSEGKKINKKVITCAKKVFGQKCLCVKVTLCPKIVLWAYLTPTKNVKCDVVGVIELINLKLWNWFKKSFL